jgi:hypothetical protein
MYAFLSLHQSIGALLLEVIASVPRACCWSGCVHFFAVNRGATLFWGMASVIAIKQLLVFAVFKARLLFVLDLCAAATLLPFCRRGYQADIAHHDYTL